jgi:polyferredoxin
MDCPQTIFLEMVFRIEYWIEGDRGAQIRLHKQEWNAEKIRKKAKMVLF